MTHSLSMTSLGHESGKLGNLRMRQFLKREPLLKRGTPLIVTFQSQEFRVKMRARNVSWGRLRKFGDISQADFGDLAGPLVAQNKTFVHYEIRVNRPMFEFIRARQLYDRARLDSLTAPQTFPDGSIVVKAAWREFSDGDPEDLRKRFYRITASTLITDPIQVSPGVWSDRITHCP